MSRSQGSLVIYQDEITLTSTSVAKLHDFEEWLAEELTKLEARWILFASPFDRRQASTK